MNDSAIKIDAIYKELLDASDDQLSDILNYINSIKKNTVRPSEKRIGKLAGLVPVNLPDDLEAEVRQARQELSSAILSKDRKWIT